ncbi:hypothetical protein IB286_10645 [Spongiibacter sp. KMU-158]|uniref:Uncharacterized protein n=1 Tax=Spongiibacter pelagi TaxID=2760804 RepID=A0A927C3R2_9GAMM|nr:DUF6134 family protein [Spongiibacter pelagi]MBD2859462.1 hypothetical protein [Spongiibacter pelagi]
MAEASPSKSKSFVPENAYFRAFLNDKAIGWHHYEFTPIEDGYLLESSANYRVKILGLTVYRYQHYSKERWVNGCLQAISSDTDDNGEAFMVRSGQTDNGLEIVTEKDRVQAPDCLKSFAYWSPDLLQDGVLMNSQNGELETVAISKSKQGTSENLLIEGDDISVSLQFEQGRWVSLSAAAPGGRTLKYLEQGKGKAAGE